MSRIDGVMAWRPGGGIRSGHVSPVARQLGGQSAAGRRWRHPINRRDGCKILGITAGHPFFSSPPLPPRPLFPLSFLSLSLSFPHTILTPTSPFPPSPSSSPFLLLLIYPSSLFLFPGRGLGGHSSHWRFRRYLSSQIRVKPFNFSLPTPFTPPCPHFPPHSLEDSRGSRNLSLIR